jgi:hypothetical protein
LKLIQLDNNIFYQSKKHQIEELKRSKEQNPLHQKWTGFFIVNQLIIEKGSGPLLTHMMRGAEQESSTVLTPGGRDALHLSIFESRNETTGGRAVQTSRTKSNCQRS